MQRDAHPRQPIFPNHSCQDENPLLTTVRVSEPCTEDGSPVHPPYIIVYPPLTLRVWPVMKLAAWETRTTTALATSLPM